MNPDKEGRVHGLFRDQTELIVVNPALDSGSTGMPRGFVKVRSWDSGTFVPDEEISDVGAVVR